MTEEQGQEDEFELPPTTLGRVNFCVKGFHDPQVGEELAHAVAGVMSVVGSFIDLEKLDGVTIACDYDEALAELDRGIEGLRPLTRSDTKEMQGIAMSPAVMRDGEVLTHLVFNAAYMVPLISDEATEEQLRMTNGIIGHECAHVAITAAKERAIPDARFGTVIEDFEHGVMFQIADICWDEYAACRMSALFAPDQNAGHAETLIASLQVAREKSDEAIRSYRRHHDIDRLVAESGSYLQQPIKAAAYLLGGMDAEEKTWEDFPKVFEALEEASYLEVVEQLAVELRRLWDTRDEWEATLGVFSGLEAIAKQVFEDGGLFFHSQPDGRCRIDVPFTATTMPF